MGGLFIDLLLFIRPYFHCPIQIPMHVFIKILVHNISVDIKYMMDASYVGSGKLHFSLFTPNGT